MLKFMVVLYKRPGMSSESFRRYLREVHGPLAKSLPGLRKYVQNFVHADPKRTPPDWDAVIELYFDDWARMEAAWASPKGAASDADLPAFVDLSRTTWSVVDEAVTVLP
jgi:uncharacterized protein (TIGR02118 family)